MMSFDVYVPKLVIAELPQGAQSEREISVIEEFFDAFVIIGQKGRPGEHRASSLSL